MVARVRLVSSSDHAMFKRNGGGGHEQADSLAVTFLKQLRPAPWAITGIVPDGRTETISARSAAEVDAFVRRINGKENVYYAVNPPRRAMSVKAKKTDIAAVEFLLADLDPRDGETPDKAKHRYLAKLEDFEPRPSAIVDSGNGLQCLWRLKKPIRLGEPVCCTNDKGKTVRQFSPEDRELIDDIEARTAAVMRKLGAKTGTQNIDRVLRLPGTINMPNRAKRKAGRVECEAALLWFESTTHALDAFPAEDAPKRARGKADSKSDTGATTDSTGEEDELFRTIRDGGEQRHGPTRSDAVWWTCMEMLRRGCGRRCRCRAAP